MNGSGSALRPLRPPARRATHRPSGASSAARSPRSPDGSSRTREWARRPRCAREPETTCASSIRGCRGLARRADREKPPRAPRPLRTRRSNHAPTRRLRSPPRLTRLAPRRHRLTRRGPGPRGRTRRGPRRPERRLRRLRRRERAGPRRSPTSRAARSELKPMGRLPHPLTRKSSRAGGVRPPARSISCAWLRTRPAAWRGSRRTPRCSRPRSRPRVAPPVRGVGRSHRPRAGIGRAGHVAQGPR